MEVPKSIKNNNLKLVKKVLMKPSDFAKTDYVGKACFTKEGYTKYGCFESWDTALSIIGHLPDNENNCDELIMPDTKVKPYIDIEYIKEENPDLHPDDVKMEVMDRLIQIFKDHFQYKLHKNDIYFAECHRKKNDTYKYSFHVVVCTEPMIVFENTNKASYVARKLREYFRYNEEIIDLNVYKKRQNFRLVGHCKPGENVPFKLCNHGDEYISKMVLTNINRNHMLLHAEEQEDILVKEIKNKGNFDIQQLTEEDQNYVINKVKEKLHPTAYLECIDSAGFFQFNYDDRDEPCFCHPGHPKPVLHDRIGFFVYIYNNILHAGCHSGNCIEQNSNSGKIRKIIYRDIGFLEKKKTSDIFLQKVNYDNEFVLDPTFVFECVKNNAFGISNLFQEMYLNPKRIKWVNGSNKNGTTYFWDGNLWIEDDFSYVERLLAATVVKVLRDVLIEYTGNEDINNLDGGFESSEDVIVTETQKIIKSLNSGVMIKNVLKFFQPLTRDTMFLTLMDYHPHFLSCKNGMVNLYTGELRKAVPDDNITKTLDIEYDENEDSSLFDDFVKEITSNEEGPCEETYNYLRWCIGYALQGNPTKKIFILLHGPHGFNGKSMLVNTISDILNYYSSPMDRSVVMQAPKKTAGSHSSELMQLEKARFGILNDTNKDDILDDGMIKQLTGITDKISAREIYGKQKEFIPKFVPFISTNHFIRINLFDKAMFERFIVIPFKLSFVDNPQKSYERKADPNLADKFKQNKKAILKWLVECSLYYNTNQEILLPESLIKAKIEYNEMVNPYLHFINNNFEEKQDAKVSKPFLLEKYKFYCMQNSIRFISKSSEEEFDKILQSIKTSKGKYYTNLQFKSELMEEDDEEDVLDL